MSTDHDFLNIQARWRDAFPPPYEGRAVSQDFGMRVTLFVYKDGVKVFEHCDLVDNLVEPGDVEDFAHRVKADHRLG